MKILLADDSKFMRTVLRGILEKPFPQMEFSEAATGVEALNTYRSISPDLMLLDLVMPEKGGIDVLKDVGSAKTGRIIVISALGQESVIEQAKALGADAFIVKPFEEKNVIETIKKATGW